MGRFEFSKNELTLDIAGVEVVIPDVEKVLDKFVENGKNAAKFNGKSIDEQREIMLDMLDDILGEDAMDAIMEKRNLSYMNCCELYAYVAEEAAKRNNEAAEKAMHTFRNNPAEVVPQAQPMAMAVENRAARRAKRRR